MYQNKQNEIIRNITEDDIEKVEEFASKKRSSVLVIFFDDMKGSTALKQRITNEKNEEAFQKIRREHDAILSEIIKKDKAGEVIKSTGDGLLAIFREPSVAVERAIEIQTKLYKHPDIKIRIGLDMGQVSIESAGGVQNDLFGRHVDWAARAEAMAKEGHILVTRSVYIDASGCISKSNVSWKEHGFFTLKEGEEAIEVFEPYNANSINPMHKPNGYKQKTKQEIKPKKNLFVITLALLFLLVSILIFQFFNKSEILITSHLDKDRISRIIKVKGTLKKVSDSMKLWLYVYAPGEGKYYFKEITDKFKNGTWEIDNVIVGADNESGASYRMGVILSNIKLTKELREKPYRTDTLPDGVQQFNEITIYRK